MYAELHGPSEPSMKSIKEKVLLLLGLALEAYEHHPYFFVLRHDADPPVLPFAHQTELLFRLSFRKPIRVLIGDEIGLGKTIEAILTVRLLEERDCVRRVLLLVPRILVEQWKSELRRFNIHARTIERTNIAQLTLQGFPEGWYVASIDLVKRENHKSRILSADWDVIIVDEAHRVGKTRTGQKSITQRYELVKELASNPRRNILLLSATPHRGHAEDYISRLKLVDPYLIGEKELDNDSFYRLTRDSIVFRRTKMDVNDVYERRKVFKKCRFVARVISATKGERRFNELLFSFLREKLLKYYEFIGEEPKALPLLLALVAKRASSSPYAAMFTLERMLKKRAKVIEGKAVSLADALDREAESIVESYLGLGFEDYGEIEDLGDVEEPDETINRFAEDCSALLEKEDIEILMELFELAKTIADKGDSRLRGVISLLREHLSAEDKVVVFTEYKDTAKYLFDKIAEELPEYQRYMALITSDGIILPGWRQRARPTIEDLKNHLRRGLIKLIISTDVASEGLNLQLANVVVNYEPTWSPIKVEQRIGRVWRLGQEKDVTSYTIFLAIRSDRDVLEVLYKKLLAWGRSLQEARVSIGEEIVIDMLSEEGMVSIPVDAVKGTPKYSEYKAIITYIRDGRIGLERYVQSIVNALANLKKNLERVGLSRLNVVFKTERLLKDVLGDFRGNNVEESVKNLFKTIASLKGLDVKESSNRIYAGSFIIETTYDTYKSIKKLLSEAPSSFKPVYIVSSASINGLKELHLFKATIHFNGRPIYSELVGIGVKSNGAETIRGRELIDIISQALAPDRLVSVVEEYNMEPRILQMFRFKASKTVANKIVKPALKEYVEYTSRLERLGFSSRHLEWYPRSFNEYRDDARYIGTVIFTTPSELSSERSTPPFKVKEIEKAAMMFALEYEKKAGRIPEDVSMREHYDILSKNPSTGEIRYIEVKGKYSLDLEIELTEEEFRVAKEKGEKYWLYIIYGIGTGKPRLLAVKDPVNNMGWREISVRRYRFRPK